MIFIPSDSPGEVFPLIIVLDKATTTGHHSCSVGKHFGVLVCANVVNVGDEELMILMMNLVHGGVPKMGEDTEGAVVVSVEGSVVDHAVVVTLIH